MTETDSAAVRLVFLGAAGVGKTALISRFLHDRFEHKHKRTVEELHRFEYEATGGGGTVRLDVLDTSGSYSFPAMRELYMRNGDAFALVYAVDDAGSLDEVRRLRAEILRVRGAANRSAPMITVVGNKADLLDESEGRVLLAADVMATVEGEWQASFVEASALTGGDAVVGVFGAMLQQVNLPMGMRRRDAASGKRRGALRKSNSCILS